MNGNGQITQLHSFQGTTLHTAQWDDSINWDGKRVAVIGNGSSAIQLLSQMQKSASQITTYLRSPTWISSNHTAHFAKDGRNFPYTEEEKREFPTLRDMFEADMKKRLKNDPHLCAKLVPDWDVGCRRLTPGDGYLESLLEKNVGVEFGDIERITPKGIQNANCEKQFDIIVCATGGYGEFRRGQRVHRLQSGILNQKGVDKRLSLVVQE
ncbi:uncharacterized protein TRUGW13939_10637 [Talaromyces rugulosus]|uniref:L-ornithine N(5)-oxygenase n=1 Tax=Talaromyces rugulosus TaxID=121627 RepID=A0A7H8RBI2_TALRU|nr:uncharacterized protein TRUGW13939_10637 [Talaromyces rugulosus]QKX63467.1 hypothetical protein TRUGW13939_10637 [Talaromyces rugulosus]